MSFDVFTARRRLGDLASAVYETVFYDAMDTILSEGLWRSYVDDVNGKTLTFSSMDEFLVSPDGLAVRDLGLFQECVKAVSATGASVASRAKALLRQLTELGMTVTVVHAEAALALKGEFAPEGRPSSDNSNNIRVSGQGQGTSAAYLAARLKKAGRDDLLEQIGPGKRFKSIRAAAIEAGIIKPVPTVRLVSDINVIAAKLCQHLTPEQRHALAEALLQ